MKRMEQKLINLSLSRKKKCEGVAYVRVSDIEEIDVPIRMHNEKEFAMLKESIKTTRIMLPLILIKKERGDGYILVDGRGRLKVAKEFGLEEVPAVIYSYEECDDEQRKEEARRLAIILNSF